MSDTNASSSFVYRAGDWTCEECGNINFARRIICNLCQKSKSPSASSKRKLGTGTEIGKAAARKSKGLFRADDWLCNRCNNVNWARRSSCNVCSAPRWGDEDRTGLGGGYNDRGVVKYKEKEDSDDDHDEFGRRKKRKNSDDSRGSGKREDRRRSEDKKEVEEEEDDEGDLSKYDLFGWGGW